MRDEVVLLITVLATILSTFIAYFLRYLSPLNSFFVAALIIIPILIVFFFFDIHVRLINVEKETQRSMQILNIIVKIMLKIQKLRNQQSITTKDLTNIFSEGVGEVVTKISDEYFATHHTSGIPMPTEQHKQDLLEKAYNHTITIDEAKELQRLLEDQRNQHEKLGDLWGAILAGLLILFIIGVLASLSDKKD